MPFLEDNTVLAEPAGHFHADVVGIMLGLAVSGVHCTHAVSPTQLRATLTATPYAWSRDAVLAVAVMGSMIQLGCSLKIVEQWQRGRR
jgi:hypothetical protein